MTHLFLQRNPIPFFSSVLCTGTLGHDPDGVTSGRAPSQCVTERASITGMYFGDLKGTEVRF